MTVVLPPGALPLELNVIIDGCNSTVIISTDDD
jgi:hypothetical protein